MDLTKNILEENPIVAAVKNVEQLDKALKTDVNVIFVLFGDILNLNEISDKIYKSNKVGIIHIDLVEGLTNKDGHQVDGWEVSNTAIPIDYVCTKVNVASCENANNVVNAEWYNRFQPYHDAHRRKTGEDGRIYRDTMEFNSGDVPKAFPRGSLPVAKRYAFPTTATLGRIHGTDPSRQHIDCPNGTDCNTGAAANIFCEMYWSFRVFFSV